MSLRIDTAAQGELQRVELTGRLDTNTAPELDEALVPVLGSGVQKLAFDLAGLEYISSAGLRTIFKAEKAVKANGGSVYVVNLQPPVQKVFEIVKALPTESIFTTWQELDDYLDGIQRRVAEGD